MLDELGANQISGLKESPHKFYDSYYGTYKLGDVQIEIMAQFKQRTQCGWWELGSHLFVEFKKIKNAQVPVASEWTLRELYSHSPRNESLPHKMDDKKFARLDKILSGNRTLQRGVLYTAYYNTAFSYA